MKCSGAVRGTFWFTRPLVWICLESQCVTWNCKTSLYDAVECRRRDGGPASCPVSWPSVDWRVVRQKPFSNVMRRLTAVPFTGCGIGCQVRVYFDGWIIERVIRVVDAEASCFHYTPVNSVLYTTLCSHPIFEAVECCTIYRGTIIHINPLLMGSLFIFNDSFAMFACAQYISEASHYRVCVNTGIFVIVLMNGPGGSLWPAAIHGKRIKVRHYVRPVSVRAFVFDGVYCDEINIHSNLGRSAFHMLPVEHGYTLPHHVAFIPRHVTV